MIRPRSSTSDTDGIGHGQEVSKKQRKRSRANATRACTTCRVKRTRCDGQPRCSTCVMHGQECIYDRESDGRKPARKQYVEALERRVKDLESRLSGEQDDSEGEAPLTASAAPSAMLSPTIATSGSLRITGQGLSHYGPTSAYAHMPDATDSPVIDQDDPQFGRAFTIADMDWGLFAWDKALPVGIVTNPDVHKTLLSIFFSYMSDWNNWCDESGFLTGLYANAFADQPVRNQQYSPFLHNVLLAVACLLAPKNVIAANTSALAAVAFAEHAHGMIDDEAKRPMTTTVRGLMLLATFHFQNTQRNLGWLYEGMGARTAQILGLHTECQQFVQRGIMSQKTKLHRDSTFYTVYTQDILWAFNVGRSPYFHRDEYETALPDISKEDDAKPWWNHKERLLANKPSARPAWRSTTFHHTVRLAQIASEIHRAWYRVVQRSSTSALSSRTKLQLDLGEWLIDLPAPIRLEAWSDMVICPHIVNLHLMYQYLRMLLHRPVCFQYAVVKEDERKAAQRECEQAAMEVLRLCQDHTDVYFSTQTVINIVFTAGTTFLLLSARTSTSPGAFDAHTALQHFDKCSNILQAMAWPSAKVLVEILKRMKQEWHPTATAATTAPKGQPTLQELQDPNSEMFQYLTKMGWAPPSVQIQPQQSQRPPSPPRPATSQIQPNSEFNMDVQLSQLFGGEYDGSIFDPYAAWPLTIGEFNGEMNPQGPQF